MDFEKTKFMRCSSLNIKKCFIG